LPKTFRFVVPMLPPRALSPNAPRKLHWGHKRDAREQMDQAWGMAIAKARGDHENWDDPIFDGPVSCRMTVAWTKDRKGMDGDNLLATMKRGLDQIEKQGVVINDGQIAYEPIAQERGGEHAGCVVVELVG
jgi:Holliday junction resolvase RusA-like endonuclease